jgi:hypothetical protein
VREFIENPMIDFLLRSQPNPFPTGALDEIFDMFGDSPDEAAFAFELEIMVVCDGCSPAIGHDDEFASHYFLLSI